MALHEIAGARGRVGDLPALLAHLSHLSGEVLVLRASRIIGKEHAESAVMHARRAFSRGDNYARSLGMESLLYLAGERQISRALSEFGVSPEDTELAILAFDNEADDVIEGRGWTRDDSLLELNEDKTRLILEGEGLRGLSPSDLALEKVAMLDINR
jgi:KEOPS complex subunit Cgi121